MSTKMLVRALFALLFILITTVYVFQFSRLVGNVLFLLPPFIAVITGVYAAGIYRLTNVHGKAMALFAAGLMCFFVGETLFFLFQFVFHTKPFPSIADVFYLAAYPLLFAGFMKEIAHHKVDWRDSNKLALILILLLSLTLTIIVSYFGIYLAYTPGDSVLSNAIAMAYGVGDLILIVPSLLTLKIALDYRGGKLFNSWILILLAIMLMMAGDILYAIYKDPYIALTWPYTLIDLAWVASYLMFAFSFFYTATTIKELHARLAK